MAMLDSYFKRGVGHKEALQLQSTILRALLLVAFSYSHLYGWKLSRRRELGRTIVIID